MSISATPTNKPQLPVAMLLLSITILASTLTSITILTGTILASNTVLADDNTSVVDEINITVPISCTISGTGMNSHNAEINNGLYQPDIGSTTLHAFCNDNEGFAIYAAGFTGDEVGGTNSNKLVGTTVSGNATIESGTATTAGNPDISNWAMKLTMTQDSGDVAGTNAFTIDSAPNVDLPSQAESGATSAPFSAYHVVPNEYTKVAHKNSGTDMTATTGGVKLTTTYAAYISKTQAADTYSGKVIYTLVHPSDTPIPKSTMLDTGQVVNGKMKTLAAGTEKVYSDKTSDIKAIRMADSLPSGFTPTDANTVSTSTSKHPIYIFFDNTNNAGIMYFYTGGYQVVMNSDSSYLFSGNLDLADISGLSNWDSSNVISLERAFRDIFELESINALSNWNTTNVENLNATFSIHGGEEPFTIGRRSKLNDISGLANWDTSNVTNINGLFQAATSLSDITSLANWKTSNVIIMSNTFSNTYSLSSCDALYNWNTSNVTSMRGMFQSSGLKNVNGLLNWNVSNVEDMYMLFAIGGDIYNSGIRSQLTNISGLSKWDTKNVKDMGSMFQYANQLTDISPITSWEVSSVTSMRNMFSRSGITSTNALTNWNVSNVTNMQYMFEGTNNLTNATSIAGWNVGNVTATAGSTSSSANYFYQMFENSPATKVPFTLRAGTWNSAGTYVPSS